MLEHQVTGYGTYLWSRALLLLNGVHLSKNQLSYLLHRRRKDPAHIIRGDGDLGLFTSSALHLGRDGIVGLTNVPALLLASELMTDTISPVATKDLVKIGSIDALEGLFAEFLLEQDDEIVVNKHSATESTCDEEISMQTTL